MAVLCLLVDMDSRSIKTAGGLCFHNAGQIMIKRQTYQKCCHKDKKSLERISTFLLSSPDQSTILARVVQKTDNAIHRINHYPAGSVVCFVKTYPLDSDLSGG